MALVTLQELALPCDNESMLQSVQLVQTSDVQPFRQHIKGSLAVCILREAFIFSWVTLKLFAFSSYRHKFSEVAK